MDAVIVLKIFKLGQLQVIGRWRNFKKVTLMSCATLCDGLMINPEIVTGEEGTSRKLFPHKEPNQKGLRLWQQVVRSIASDDEKLPIPLVQHRRESLRDSGRYSSEIELELYKRVHGNTYKVLRMMDTDRQTCQDEVS